MTAVASPPSFADLNRQGWINGGQTLNSIKSNDAREMNMFMSRKTLQRTNSSSSVSSTSSNGSSSTLTSNASSQSINGTPLASAGDSAAWSNAGIRKKPQQKGGPWANGKPEQSAEFSRLNLSRGPITNGVNGTSSIHQQQSLINSQNQLMAQNGLSQRPNEGSASGRRPALYLLSLNGSFERKTIEVPFYPDTLRIGRQTNNKTVPTPQNGFFDSKVLSRQHAEIWADANGKIWIRDIKSSNGTFVNGSRLSPENRESEPHELQTQDHLELGIDIVSEDQKTVVHHKVAAKVEHAGFINPANNVLDMNFGDLDPSNGSLMPLGGAGFRGRTGSQASLGGGRAPQVNTGGPPNTTAQQRQYWLNPITTEHIVKKLHAEMRNARLQNQDLARTGQFLNSLLSKDDIKNMDKPELPEPQKTHLTNGNVSFRSDGGKTRFSEPPAPPPSQPLPEKPDAARPASSDIASLKRSTTERPKATSTSPIRPDNNSLQQILQLTEQLNSAKKALDDNSERVRDLEEKLNKEREARLQAEEMMQKMEESHSTKANGSAVAPLVNGHSELENAFDPPAEQAASEPEQDVFEDAPLSPQPDKAESLAAEFQSRIDSVTQEMNNLRQQLEAFRLRAEKAEAERDSDRKTLAEMVAQIRQRDEEERKRAAERQSRSRSKGRRRPSPGTTTSEKSAPAVNGKAIDPCAQNDGAADEVESIPTLSRASTAKPAAGALALQGQDPKLSNTLPYASMIGVVLIGMGLMAYLNGWQPKSRLDL
ncbi:vacuolar protein sorting-associated protein 64 [Cladorrhinum sp. PSN259]|nr:vacuolar protein sorting-associated protein 64 [Cladorrhinum sp. PSN259]